MDIQKIQEAYEKAGDLECDGVKFDEPNYDMLIVTQENYLQALKMQAAAIAYYGTLAKQAERNVEQFERKYKFRYNEMYTDCSDTLSRLGKSSTVKIIESFVQTKYEKELQTLNQTLQELKKQSDLASVFYEGIKQKSFMLNNYTSLVTSNLLSPKTSVSESDIDEQQRSKLISRLRNI